MGRRVSVRRVVERAADGRLLQSDVVGDLIGLDAQTAVVDTRGGLIEVPVALVTAAKTVPPSTADELALQAVAARGLRAAESVDLHGWLLRADHGFTRRANSVLPLHQLSVPLDDAIDRAADWYRSRGLPLLIQVPLHARRLLDAGLAERGWPALDHTLVLARRLEYAEVMPSGSRVEIAATPDAQWLARYRGGAGRTGPGAALLARHEVVGFASIRRDGHTVAIGRGAVDDGWLGVMAVEVAAEHRREGLARAVTAALWAWGIQRGATRSYLQVSADNAAATALYAKLGYWHHHDYHYRRPNDPAAGDAPPEHGPWTRSAPHA